MRVKTTPIAVFSEEYGGGLKRFLCLGTHVWTKIDEAHTKEKLKDGRKIIELHHRITIYKCVDCGRRWILVTRWAEWD